MCGIAGELRFDRRVSDPSITRAMCDAQIHRGPDEEAYYTNAGLTLGIRRLAIVNSSKGLYPLGNEDGTVHLVLDGDPYGLRGLRVKLERRGHKFCSRTGAELVVHGYEEWGPRFLHELSGMFAFALWDEARQLLWLTRDHFGVKPLHYHKNSKFLAFASEIKPLLRHPEVPVRPNEKVIMQYLQSERVDTTQDTFFLGVNRLSPANYMLVHSDGVVERERYWKPNISKRVGSEGRAAVAETTRLLFIEAVRQQLVRGIRAGVSLSGGIDSSSIISVMRRIDYEGITSNNQQIRTFSAVFPGDVIDESGLVRTVCKATNAENFAVAPTWEDFWRDLPTLVRCQEEPFDASFAYSHWRVMKCASERGAKVMLEGHGGDELLCGYPDYYFYYFLTLVKHIKWRKLLVEALLSRDLVKDAVKTLVARVPLPSILTYIGSVIIEHFLKRATQLQQSPSSEESQPSRTLASDLASKLEIDVTALTLPPALRCVDRNSMWHSIEVRVPFLQKAFFDYFASLPLDLKIRDGWTKYAFRRAMKGLLPEQIRLRRTKIGFQTPRSKWIENELRGKLLDFFSGPDLRSTRYYSAHAARSILEKRTLSDWENRLIWRLLNLEMWYREFFSAGK